MEASAPILSWTEIETMKSEEPVVFTQMCLNMLKYITPDLSNDATRKILEIREFKPSLGGVGSNPVRKSSRDMSADHMSLAVATKEPICDSSICMILIKYLENYCEKEGIFRIPGNQTRIERLTVELEERNLINFAKKRYSHNDVCSVLKGYLRRSPHSLIEPNLHKAHLLVADITFDLDLARQQRVKNWESDDKFQYCEVSDPLSEEFVTAKNRHIEALQILMSLMSKDRYDVLKSLIGLLYSIAKKQSLNKMSATNLATIFTPSVLWPLPPVIKNGKHTFRHHSEADLENMQKSCYAVTFMIRHFNRIFTAPHAELVLKVSQYYTAKQIIRQSRALTPSRFAATETLHPSLARITRSTCHQKNTSAGFGGSLKRTLFSTNPVTSAESSAKLHPSSRDSTSRKRPVPCEGNEKPDLQEKKSKRSRSVGASLKSRLVSSVAGLRKNSAASQLCSAQQLYVQSELGGLMCSSPAGIKSPGSYQLLF